MTDPKDPMAAVRWILGFLIVIYALWYFTGAYDRSEDKDKPFIKQPDPLDSGEAYGPETEN